VGPRGQLRGPPWKTGKSASRALGAPARRAAVARLGGCIVPGVVSGWGAVFRRRQPWASEIEFRGPSLGSQLLAGETVAVPIGKPHTFEVEGGGARFVTEFRPAHQIGEFFRALFALPAEGRLDRRGNPRLRPCRSQAEAAGGLSVVSLARTVAPLGIRSLQNGSPQYRTAISAT